MSRAFQILSQMESLQKEVNIKIVELSKEQSRLDKELSRIYHKAETNKFNAAEGYYIAKELQETTRERRAVKQDLEYYQTLKHNMGLNESFGNKIKQATKTLHSKRKRNLKYTYWVNEENGEENIY
ncbi:hypothetical protein [Priestia flexa]|uniref:hypothetical protein n=1 Tax=Priestia flexa TaxID=86664 RepID=UPI0004736EB8|nr:hypothetical protein [Priestia flexa]